MTIRHVELLAQMEKWLSRGEDVALATVTAVHGSTPCQPGSMLAVTSSGVFFGSVSGGCVDEAIIRRVKETPPTSVERLSFGDGEDGGYGLALSCGGIIELALEPVRRGDWVEAVLEALQQRQFVQRRISMPSGTVEFTTTPSPANADETPYCDEQILVTGFGPDWRLILIGANQTSAALARLALLLDYQLVVCEPRQSYRAKWDVPGVSCMPDMPDKAVRELKPDRHTAVVGLSHDAKIDDLALLEALRSEAFYIGVMGSHKSQELRHERLRRHFGITAAELSRLHGPVGLPLGSKDPVEIALAIIAELTALRNGKRLVLQTAP